MGHEVRGRNAEALERLRAIAGRLSDEELLRAIDPPWTTSALFAHMAFWDRFTESRWIRARETGRSTPLPIDDEPLERINLAGLHQWLLLPPRVAVEECLAAAEAVDLMISSVDPEVVQQLRNSDRERLVDRSLHRDDHLRTLEAAIGDGEPPPS